MYKIISIKDKDGNEKIDFYNEIKSAHPNMSGEIIFKAHFTVGGFLCLMWSDDTDKMLRTSRIKSMTIDEEETIEVVTRNSIYILEKI